MGPEPVVTLKDVSFSYGGPLVLDHVNLTIDRGEFFGLVGPNAGGKSTLLKLVLGLLSPLSGQVTVLGRSPQESRTAVGYVPQFPSFSRDFPVCVHDAVLLGRLGRTSSLGRYRSRDRSIAAKAMQEVGIHELRSRRLSTLSGGQLQRVLIARALCADPEILILDEPTANIDMRAEEDIFDLLRRLNARMTILVVSHDVGFISRYVTRVGCLNRTLMCHQTADITGVHIEELYGTPVTMIQHEHGDTPEATS